MFQVAGFADGSPTHLPPCTTCHGLLDTALLLALLSAVVATGAANIPGALNIAAVYQIRESASESNC